MIYLEFDHFSVSKKQNFFSRNLHLVQYSIFQLNSYNFFTAYDGVCDQTQELQILYGSMPDVVKWSIISSGRYLFARFADNKHDEEKSLGFFAKIHFGKEIQN